MTHRIFLLLIIAAAIFGIFFLYLEHRIDDPQFLRSAVWHTIKVRFVQPNGFVASEGTKTTSESQSYTMLIAVAMDDRKTFDKIWQWTRENLGREGDNLFAWHWENGKIKDAHTAPDADQDFAYALILAGERWGDSRYEGEAKAILRDFWEKDTKIISGTRYVTGGDWALEDPSGVIINPSYLAPYLYRRFATFDPEHDWSSLVDSSYKALSLCSGPKGLPQDWCKLNQNGDIIHEFEFGEKDPRLYSYDAFRVPYRSARDFVASNDGRSLTYIRSNLAPVQKTWEQGRIIHARYGPDATPAGPEEALASYGTHLAAFSVLEKKIADEIYRIKIANLTSLWFSNPSFYDLAWVWFGVDFYNSKSSK